MNKAELRKQIKLTLSQYKENFKSDSQRICSQIINSDLYKSSSIILAYMALPDEVDLSTVITQALEDNKTVYLPHVYPNTSKMEFFQFTKKTPVITGEFGIKEPDFSGKTEFTPSKENTLILVPGRAFTKQGDRLGRGKGFYDIYMESFKHKENIKKAGICFPPQILNELPVSENDIPMNVIFC